MRGGLIGVAIVVAVGVVVLLAIGIRWHTLNGRAGAFVCVLIEGTGPKRRELPGVARFGPSSLDWYRRGSLALRPAHSWSRRSLTVRVWSDLTDPADADRPESWLRGSPENTWEVVRLTAGEQDYLMVLSQSAESGLISWKEAGPTRTEPMLPA